MPLTSLAVGAGTAAPESLVGSTAVELPLVAVGCGCHVPPLVAVGCGCHVPLPLVAVGGGHHVPLPLVAVGGGRYLTAVPPLSILVVHNTGSMTSALSAGNCAVAQSV